MKSYGLNRIFLKQKLFPYLISDWKVPLGALKEQVGGFCHLFIHWLWFRAMTTSLFCSPPNQKRNECGNTNFQNDSLYFKGYCLERLLDIIVFSAHYCNVKMKLLERPNTTSCYIYRHLGGYNVTQSLRTRDNFSWEVKSRDSWDEKICNIRNLDSFTLFSCLLWPYLLWLVYTCSKGSLWFFISTQPGCSCSRAFGFWAP